MDSKIKKLDVGCGEKKREGFIGMDILPLKLVDIVHDMNDVPWPFNGNEFEKVRKGLQDDSIDILCRYCDNLCYNVDLFAKIFNFPYLFDRYMYYLKDLHNLNDLNIIM